MSPAKKSDKKMCPAAGEDLITVAKETLRQEASGLSRLVGRLDDTFSRAVEMILDCRGRVVITGMGKSGHIGRKIAATLSSTGTPALFLHPAEGVHGDLGQVTRGDILVALSYGGETSELTTLLPAIKRLGVPIIAFCGRKNSVLARQADVVLDVSVEKEACPFDLVPTASTTAMLALGDALSVVVMRARRFTEEDFQRLHPSGRLGRRMLMKVKDIMRTGDNVALVGKDTPLQEVLFAITRAHAGSANVVDEKGKLQGFISDGDIRRHLLSDEKGLRNPAHVAMTPRPKRASPDQLASEALLVMEKYQIGEMPVLDEVGCLLGVLNLKDLLRAGIV